MRRFTAIGDMAGAEAPVHLALGVFDGIHLGHREVIGRAFAARARDGGSCGVLTFDPYPLRVLFPEKAPKRLLASLDHKASLLEPAGVDFLLALPFDHRRAAEEPEDFLRELAAAGVKTMAVGEDWRFGRDRRGDAALLHSCSGPLDFRLETVPPVMMDGDRISSTRIRQAIRDGNLEAAARMLGRPYTVLGQVVKGRQLGRTMGFPTANVACGDEQLPPEGVWAVRAHIHPQGGGEAARLVHDGVANLGRRPTVDGDSGSLSLEVHLFGDPGDLYGLPLEVEFVHHLRGERSFAGLDELKAQIGRDAEQAMYLLRGTAPQAG